MLRPDEVRAIKPRGERLAHLPESEAEILTASGQEPHCRIPDVVNPLTNDFLRTTKY